MGKQTKTQISGRSAEALFFPIAAFLLSGGLSKSAAQRSFAAAMAKAQKHVRRRVDHIGHPTHYADVVASWTHDPRFIDRDGQPRRLAFEGKNGFVTLVKSVSPALDPRSVLAVLRRYGNVRATRGGHYVLARPFFFTSNRSSLAFEPLAYFLSDASATLTRILTRTNAAKSPELFWRKVESTGLSAKVARDFTSFVRERSLDFLEELDDWLEAHRSRSTRMNTMRRLNESRRVGLGLFSIYSDPEPNLSKGRRR